MFPIASVYWFRMLVVSSNMQAWLLATTLSGQFVLRLGRHRLIIRGRGVELAGDVRFWERLPARVLRQ